VLDVLLKIDKKASENGTKVAKTASNLSKKQGKCPFFELGGTFKIGCTLQQLQNHEASVPV